MTDTGIPEIDDAFAYMTTQINEATTRSRLRQARIELEKDLASDREFIAKKDDLP